MVNLNVEISDEAYRRAKVAAGGRGMFLKRWVEELILDATEQVKAAGESTDAPRETSYVPIEEA